ncbi:hypothetical protein [Kitasatospora sp. NPDC004289]
MTHDTTELADFDEFFAERKAQRGPGQPLRLAGRTYRLPTQTPLAYTLLLEANDDRSDAQAIREVLTPLFGESALDDWVKAGMGDEDFEIVLAWSIANMRNPGSMSMAEAARRVTEAEAGKAQAPRNRAERRAKPKHGTSGKRS